MSFGGPFGHLGSSQGASWSILDTPSRQQDAALRTDVFPGPKLVPDPLPKRASAAQAAGCGSEAVCTFDPPESVFVWGIVQFSQTGVLQPLQVTD